MRWYSYVWNSNFGWNYLLHKMANVGEGERSKKQESEEYNTTAEEYERAAVECFVGRLGVNDDPETNQDIFTANTAMFLLGLGLKVHEVELFEKHGLGLNQIITFTERDLVHIGITCPKKRQAVMEVIDTLRSSKKELPEKETEVNCEKVVINTTKHLQKLANVLPDLRDQINSVNEDCFFSNGVSAAYTMDLILELCVQQSKQTHEQLMILARKLDKDTEEEESNKKFNRKKWLFLIILSGSCASLLAWGLRSVGSGFLSFRWPTWFSK